MSSMFVKAETLRKGDTFKFSPRVTKQYWIGQIHDFRTSAPKGTPKEHIGKIVIETIPSKMYPISPDQEVFLVHSPTSKQ